MCSISLSSPFRANDGCLYVFDLEQNKRTLKVSASNCFFVLLVGPLVPAFVSRPLCLFVHHPAIKVSQTLADLPHKKFHTAPLSVTQQQRVRLHPAVGQGLNPPPSSSPHNSPLCRSE